MADLAYTNSNIPQPAQTGSGGLPGVGADPNAPFWSGFNSSAYGQQEQNQLGLQDLAKQSAQIDLQNKQYDQPNVQSLSDVGLARNQATLQELPGQTQFNMAKTSADTDSLYQSQLANSINRVLKFPEGLARTQALQQEIGSIKQQFPGKLPDQIPPAYLTTEGLTALRDAAVQSIPHQQDMERQESINKSNEKVATTHADASRFGATTAANAAIHDTDSKVKSAKEVAQIEAQAKRDVALQQIKRIEAALGPDKAAVSVMMQAAKEKRPLTDDEKSYVEAFKSDQINKTAAAISQSPAFMTKILQAQQNNDSKSLDQIYSQINDLATRQAMTGYQHLFKSSGMDSGSGGDNAPHTPPKGYQFQAQHSAKQEDVDSFNHAYAYLKQHNPSGIDALVAKARKDGTIY